MTLVSSISTSKSTYTSSSTPTFKITREGALFGNGDESSSDLFSNITNTVRLNYTDLKNAFSAECSSDGVSSSNASQLWSKVGQSISDNKSTSNDDTWQALVTANQKDAVSGNDNQTNLINACSKLGLDFEAASAFMGALETLKAKDDQRRYGTSGNSSSTSNSASSSSSSSSISSNNTLDFATQSSTGLFNETINTVTDLASVDAQKLRTLFNSNCQKRNISTAKANLLWSQIGSALTDKIVDRRDVTWIGLTIMRRKDIDTGNVNESFLQQYCNNYGLDYQTTSAFLDSLGSIKKSSGLLA